jgi:hypothetical protein
MISTLPSRPITAALSYSLWIPDTPIDESATLITRAYQPLVRSCCTVNILKFGGHPGSTYLNFGNDTSLDHSITFAEAFEYSVANFSMSFHKVPDYSAKNHSALVFYGFQGDAAIGTKMHGRACTVDAMWVPSTLNQSANSATNFLLEQHMMQYAFTSGLISISPAWTKGMTDVVKPSLYIPDDTFLRTVHPSPYIAVGLSNSNENTLTSVEYTDPALNERGRLSFEQWHGHTAYIKNMHMQSKHSYIETLTSTAWSDPRQLSQQIIYAMRRGYGYSYADVTVQLSLAVVGLYCLITVFYLAYTLLTGLAGSSWDSISELLMLGLCSPRPDHLKHISAGVATLSTFREPVSVRVNDEDSLQLVFDKDITTGKVRYRKVEHNKAY